MAPDTVAMLMLAGQGPSRVVRLAQLKEPVSAKTLVQFASPAAGMAAQFGFTTFDRAETVVQVGAATVSAWTDFQGFDLKPGAQVTTERLRIGLERDPYAALDAWTEAVQAHYQPRIWKDTPAGWLGWSWVDPLHSERYEDIVRRNIRAVRRRLAGHDVNYVWVSLGNLKDRVPGNWLKWNTDNFPSGPEALARDLESLQFRLGLWCGAFWMNSGLTDEVERLRDAFLLWHGKPVTTPHRELGSMFSLDPTHPKTQALLRDVFSTYRRWGVRYYMIDFLDSISGATPGRHLNDGYFDKARIPGPEAWREGLRTIRQAAGEDTYLLESTGPTLQTIGWMDGIRAGSDYGEGRPLDGPGKGFFPGTFVIDKPDFWTSHRTATDAMAGYFFTHRKLFLADSGNVMTVDKPIPLADAQITATIFGINGSPVMLGDDIDRMDEERVAMIRRVLPRLPECARPVDLFEAVEPDYPKVFHLPVRKDWDRWDLLAVFNYGAATLRKTVPLVRLGLDAASPYAVWDFWNERFQGVSRGSVEVEVAPESVRLLRIARDRGHPWLVSTDMHVRQGQAEITDCRWDASSAMLTIRTQRPAGEHGSVFVRAPAGWALADPRGLWVAKDGRDGSLLARKAVAFESAAPVEVTMKFQKR
jgi:alpha-galactosidase